MLSVYSFKGHFLESVLNHAPALFPGAERVLAVYYDNALPGLASKERKLNTKENIIVSGDSTRSSGEMIVKLRKQRPRTTWLKNIELTTSPAKAKTQLDIHSEWDNHVLLIRFPNAPDGFSDLLFVFFKNEDRIFQFSGNPQKLSTSLKESVANILVRSLDVMRKQNENDAKIHQLINQSDQRYKNEISSLQHRINQSKQQQINFIRKYATSILASVSSQTGIVFNWSDESILKLLELPFEALKRTIENTVTVVVNKMDNLSGIEIMAIDLVMPETQKPMENKVVSIRYERTLQLLDRYEESAKKVVQAKLPLTGVNLGRHCDPPVSPAAISDALKKHSKKIITLFEQNPNKWSLLRQEFRPVKNMVYRTGLSQNLAS